MNSEASVPAKARGSVKATLTKNPNAETELNSAPDGPHGPLMGEPGNGGYDGSVTAKGKNGNTFYFK